MLKIKMIPANSSKGLSLLTGINRKIIPSQVTKLANSIDKMGIIRPVVTTTISFVSGRKEIYIIDGQHLFNACLRKGIEIPTVEIEIANMKDLVEKIAMLNASSKSWTLSDYILSWQAVNPDYKKLNHYYEVYDLEMSQIAELLHFGTITKNNTGSGNAVASRIIKTGQFKIQNEPEAIRIMDHITDVLKTVPRMDRISNKLFISCYVIFYKQWGRSYNHKNFLEYLIKNKSKFILATQDHEELTRLISKAVF